MRWGGGWGWQNGGCATLTVIYAHDDWSTLFTDPDRFLLPSRQVASRHHVRAYFALYLASPTATSPYQPPQPLSLAFKSERSHSLTRDRDPERGRVGISSSHPIGSASVAPHMLAPQLHSRTIMGDARDAQIVVIISESNPRALASSIRLQFSAVTSCLERFYLCANLRRHLYVAGPRIETHQGKSSTGQSKQALGPNSRNVPSPSFGA